MRYAIIDRATNVVVSIVEGERPPPTMLGYDAGPIAADANPIGQRLVSGVFVAVPVPLPDAQAARWRDAKIVRTSRMAAGCATAKGRVQTDPASRDAITQAATDAANNRVAVPGWSIAWTMTDNSVVPHSAAEMIAMQAAVRGYVSQMPVGQHRDPQGHLRRRHPRRCRRGRYHRRLPGLTEDHCHADRDRRGRPGRVLMETSAGSQQQASQKTLADGYLTVNGIAVLITIVVGLFAIWKQLRSMRRENEADAQRRADEIKDQIRDLQVSLGERVTKIETSSADWMPRREIEGKIDHERNNRIQGNESTARLLQRHDDAIVAVRVDLGRLEQQQAGTIRDVSDIKDMLKEQGRDHAQRFDKLQDCLNAISRKTP